MGGCGGGKSGVGGEGGVLRQADASHTPPHNYPPPHPTTHLRAVCHRGQRGERALLHVAPPPLQQRQQLADQGVKVGG